MVVLWSWGYSRLTVSVKRTRKVFILLAIVWIGYGIAMEFVQLWCVKNRSFDVGDIIADTLGCGAGYLFSTGRYIKK